MRALAGARELLALNGVTEPQHLDMWTALLTGLVDQQVSNDPGGDRWARLIDESISMFLSHCSLTRASSTPKPSPIGPKEPTMTMTTTDVTTIGPLTHDEAMRLQAHELERMLVLLRSLDDAAWTAATDCPAWDVRAMCRHVLGACEAGASMRENVHQMRRAWAYRKRHGGPLEAALSAVQVRDRAQLAPAQVVDRLTAIAPKTVRGRTRVPALVRNQAKLKVDGPVYETWKLGYLIDTIYLRDLWMHRVDVARAIDRPLELSAGHDGRIVADIVVEWARRHGQPFVVDLTGPAGGTYAQRPDALEAERVELDAVEFCRTLAGRAEATGLLATIVPF